MPKASLTEVNMNIEILFYISFITTICFRDSVRCFILGHGVKEAPVLVR